RRRREPARHRPACVGRLVRSALERDRRLRPAAAPQNRSAGTAVADSRAPRRRLPAGGRDQRRRVSIPIRARLTLWYVAVLAVILTAFSAGVLWLQGRFSRAQFDSELASVAMTVSGVLRGELADGK